MFSKKTGLKSHMVLSLAYKVTGMLVGLISVPILLQYLGDEKYGIWAIITSLLSWITYFDIGIGNGLRNRLAEQIGKKNNENQGKLVSTAYISVAAITGFVYLLALASLILFDIPNALNIHLVDENLNIILFINLTFISINFVLSLCNAIIYAFQIASLVSLLGIVPQVMNLVVILILASSPSSNLTVLSILFGLTIFITNLSANIILFITHKRLAPKFKLFDRGELNSISSFGIKIFISQIAALVLNLTDNILISILYGSEYVTVYSLVYRVFFYISIVHTTIIIPIVSAYTLAQAEKNYIWLNRTLKKTLYILLPFVLAILGVMILFRPISLIWLGREIAFPSNLIVLTGCYFIALCWTNTFSSFLLGVSNINKMTYCSIAQAVLNIPLSILFAKYFNMGLAGIVSGSLAVMLIAVVILPLETKRHFKKLDMEQL